MSVQVHLNIKCLQRFNSHSPLPPPPKKKKKIHQENSDDDDVDWRIRPNPAPRNRTVLGIRKKKIHKIKKKYICGKCYHVSKKKWQEIYRWRNDLIRQTCERNGLSNYRQFGSELLAWSSSPPEETYHEFLEGYHHGGDYDAGPAERKWRDFYPVAPDKVGGDVGAGYDDNDNSGSDDNDKNDDSDSGGDDSDDDNDDDESMTKVTDKIPFQTLLYNRDRRLTYCWTHKVASTSWNEIFLDLVGKKVWKMPKNNPPFFFISTHHVNKTRLKKKKISAFSHLQYHPRLMYRAMKELKPAKTELEEALSDRNFR